MLLFFITFFYFILKKKIDSKNVLYLFSGLLFSFFAIASVFYVNEIPPKNFLLQYILYPLSLGGERIDKLEINFNNLINQFKFIYLALAPMALSLFFYKKIEKKELIISLFFLFSILTIILIFFTTIIKNSTKDIDVKIFNIKEDIRVLKEKYELVLLDHNYLSSPKKLNEYQKKYFENELVPTDITDIGEIDFYSKNTLAKEVIITKEEKNEK